MNVIHRCAACGTSLEAMDAVYAVTRDVPSENTGTIDPVFRADDRYVHPECEISAHVRGYRTVHEGTLIELERQRNPSLFATIDRNDGPEPLTDALRRNFEE